MPDLQTLYNPAGVSQTAALPAGGAGGGGDMSFFLDIIKKKLAWEAAFNQRKLASMDAQLGDADRARHAGTNQPRERQQSSLQKAQTAAEMAKAKAISGPAPKKWNTYGFYEPDTLNMTGAQRQMFGPEQAGMERGGASSSSPSGISPHKFAPWAIGEPLDDAQAARDKEWETSQAQRLALLRSSAAEPTYGSERG
jgi:hypothetical protein